METTRIDRWLVAVRLFKNRVAATDACRGGKVRINDMPCKPASAVRVGDRIEARVGDRNRVVEVVRVIEKRVGAPIAAECFVDHSPPVEPTQRNLQTFRRSAGSGRPTKRDRRDLDNLRGD